MCSDKTVVDDDAAVSHTSDLGVPVTTSPTEIAGFLRRRSVPRVMFATYQSSPQIARAFKLGRVPGFDLVVADEAHRCAGPTTSEFATILDPAKIKATRRLFMTATPRYFTGRIVREAKEADYEVASMDDEAKFGTVFHRLPFGEAIERELLTDYQVAVVGVDNATYREWAERGELVILDGSVRKTDARTLAGQIGLAKAIKKYDLHRTITFHSRVKRASDFARSMPGVLAWMPPRQRPKGALWADFASGEMSAGDREIRLRHLSVLDVGERGVLANARCLAEGVDVPTLDGVAFIDPRRSEVDIVQAVGRAIRKSSDKTVGTIVIPVFIDTDEDAETALDDSVFKPVWDVIKALRSHDEELGEQLDELRRNLGKRRGIIKSPNKIHLDLPSKVGKEFADAFDVRLVERTTASWEFWFGKIQEFASEHGHARVGSRYVTADGFRLGAWVANQRSHYAKGTLKAERAELLETVDGWTWDPVADYWIDQWAEQWEEGFRQLQRYVDKHADARVPSDHTTNDGYRLGWWTVWQRELHGKGELDEERERRLCELPGWSWDVRAEQWEEGFRQLQLYVDQHGDARVPKTFVIDGFTLGVWVAVQRRGFSRGTLEGERRERLEALPGWSWDPFADAWEEGFRWLLDYVAQKGNTLVPRSYVVDGYALGAWVKKQRGIYNRGQLGSDRSTRLAE
ncbi:Helicase associated domain protein [Mycolicibacterium sp.]|uniref:helicase associated domain-containing protein n=1 Tax=Mycolicibacterium sp. TaxID=2320850 RepID=UPI003D0BCF20